MNSFTDYPFPEIINWNAKIRREEGFNEIEEQENQMAAPRPRAAAGAGGLSNCRRAGCEQGSAR
ncbi:hypothetical protein D3C72_2430260 [compost metagenome]